jgi:hypothetical protein
MAGREDSDYVEARGFEGWLLYREVVLCEGADSGLLTRGDGVEWVAVARPPSQLHFDEDEGGSVAQDQVELAVSGPVIAFDEVVATLGQVAQREVLAPGAGGAFAQRPTPA